MWVFSSGKPAKPVQDCELGYTINLSFLKKVQVACVAREQYYSREWFADTACTHPAPRPNLNNTVIPTPIVVMCFNARYSVRYTATK